MIHRPSRRRLLALLLLLPGAALATDALQAFRAEYRVHYLRMHAADVRLTLARDGEGWTMHRRSRAASGPASWLAGDKLKMDEQSWFTLQDNRPLPSTFSLRKPGAKRGRRSVDITFENGSAEIRSDRGEPRRVDIGAGAQDPVSAVLAVMQHMAESREDFSLPVVDRRGQERAHFELVGEAQIEIDDKRYDTLHIAQRTKKRTTDYWLAVDHHMIPLKIRHQETDEEPVEMVVESIALR